MTTRVERAKDGQPTKYNVEVHAGEAVDSKIPGRQASISVWQRIPDEPDHSTLFLSDARQIMNALVQTLPQGTWAALVAVIATEWAEQQQGIITAQQWYRRPENAAANDQVIAELQAALAEYAHNPCREHIKAALGLLGAPVKE